MSGLFPWRRGAKKPKFGPDSFPRFESVAASEPSGAATARLHLSSTEVKLLEVYVRLLDDEIMDLDNPRLYPEAHVDDQELQTEFAELTQHELQTSRRKAMNALTGTLAGNKRELFTNEQLDSWLTALNVLHLALGAKLEDKGTTLGDRDTLEAQLDNLDEDDRFEVAAYCLMSDILVEASQFMLTRRVLEFEARS